MKFQNLITTVIETLLFFKKIGGKFSIHDVTKSIRDSVNNGKLRLTDAAQSGGGLVNVDHSIVKNLFESILPLLSVKTETAFGANGEYRQFEFVDPNENVVTKDPETKSPEITDGNLTNKNFSDFVNSFLEKAGIPVSVSISGPSDTSQNNCDSGNTQSNCGCKNQQSKPKSGPVSAKDLATSALNHLFGGKNENTTPPNNYVNSSPSDGKVVFNQPKVTRNLTKGGVRENLYLNSVKEYYKDDFSKYDFAYDSYLNTINKYVEEIKAYFNRNKYVKASLRNIAKSVGHPCSFVAYCIWKSEDGFEFHCDHLEPKNHFKNGSIKNADAISVYFHGAQ